MNDEGLRISFDIFSFQRPGLSGAAGKGGASRFYAIPRRILEETFGWHSGALGSVDGWFGTSGHRCEHGQADWQSILEKGPEVPAKLVVPVAIPSTMGTTEGIAINGPMGLLINLSSQQPMGLLMSNPVGLLISSPQPMGLLITSPVGPLIGV